MGKTPHLRVITASYGADLAIRNSRATQEIIDSDKFRFLFPGVRLNRSGEAEESSNAARKQNLFEIVGTNGYYKSVGIGGALTGFGAQLGIIDDYYKNQQEAQSFSHREKVLNWYRTVFRTRLSKFGILLVVSTRWDSQDLVASLLDLQKSDPHSDKWEVLNLPAMAKETRNEGDPREEGEALWPDQFPIEELKQIKSSLGSYWFNSLYQQDPQPREGQLIKPNWLKFYQTLPDSFDEVIQSWDLSFQGKETSDWTVGQVWARKGANKYLLYMIRDKLDFNEQISAIEAMSVLYPKAVLKLIEHAANADAVLATLSHRIPGLVLVKPKTSKAARLLACSPEFEAGNIWFPDPSSAPWVVPLIDELMGFGSLVHEDTVDGLTQAIIRLKGLGVGSFSESMEPSQTSSALDEMW